MDIPPDRHSPEGHRAVIRELSETAFQLWRHNPVTAAYMQHLRDRLAAYREAAMDMFEAGQFVAGAPHVDRNPDSMRGQIYMLRELIDMTLEQMQGFYKTEEDNNE